MINWFALGRFLLPSTLTPWRRSISQTNPEPPPPPTASPSNTAPIAASPTLTFEELISDLLVNVIDDPKAVWDFQPGHVHPILELQAQAITDVYIKRGGVLKISWTLRAKDLRWIRKQIRKYDKNH
jgi:hypothetical protein